MTRLRPGWLVVLFAVVIEICAWLPWRLQTVDPGGHINAIGGATGGMAAPTKFDAGQLIVLLASTLIVAGAMVARGLSARVAAVAALVLSLCIGALIFVYYRQTPYPDVKVTFGMYIGIFATTAALMCSLWAVYAAWSAMRAAR